MDPDRAIAAVAASQHGVFTARQAQLAGLTRYAIRHRVESGRWLVPYRGVYAIAGAPRSWERDVSAAVLAYGPSAAASGPTAGALWGLIDEEPSIVHITLPSAQHRAGRNGIVVHRASLTRGDVRTVRGIRLTSPRRTLVDLAGHLAPPRLEAALDNAAVRGLVSVRSLRGYVEDRRLGNQRGAGVLRRLVADRTSGVMESELERLFLRKVRRCRLPEPDRQYRLGTRRIDFAYPTQRIAIELDGLGSHFSGDAFRADRRRQNEFVLQGWTPLRFTWEDVASAWPQVERTLRAALTRVG